MKFLSINGLPDADIRINTETGEPEWSPRGADTWSPFMSNKITSKAISCRVNVFDAEIGKYYIITSQSNSSKINITGCNMLSEIKLTSVAGQGYDVITYVVLATEATITCYGNHGSGAHLLCGVIELN